LAPQNAEYRYKLGLALSELGRLGDARAALEQAVALEPQFARAWYNLGLAYHAAGQTENAIQSLLRAEAADPRAAQFPYARATILARLGRVAEARAAAGRALQLQPNYREALDLLEALSQ
jgi:Flp pilus assembly protein TadD